LKPTDALAAAKALSDRPTGSVEDAARFGDLLSAADRYDEAANAYRLAIRRSGRDPSWTLYLRLAAALDDGADWPQARAALERAAAMAPDSPFVLNYLGYAQIQHGEDIAKSVAMLERANALQPGNASIIDSLAWAYFHRNDAARAVPMLEQAAQVEPANATINEHLGDAYWSLGRRYEARYAWRAAAIIADEDDGVRLARKIAEGLPPRTRATP
jgi:tetratricopeptide (TPR) repeat protein